MSVGNWYVGVVVVGNWGCVAEAMMMVMMTSGGPVATAEDAKECVYLMCVVVECGSDGTS